MREVGPDGSGEAQSAFRPLGVQGGLSSFVPRPGSAENPKDGCHRKSQAFLKSSSCLQRNAITSSYSFTRCFPLVERRRQPTTCHTRLPQRSSNRVSQKGPQTPCSASMFSQRKSQSEKDQDGPSRQKRSPRNRLPCNSFRPQELKVPMLPHRGRGREGELLM
ncbi:hypothetical protein HJG60_007969 [Phyllostomus discolor]|uniref:Uncharacterized protein n=1 Tax=Phyllostomus discolor TaxID=89673 RepID=A0A834BL20_9CHIR|nr:hypothetical protein HJG60_007969 [Phyllostomus discolor]